MDTPTPAPSSGKVAIVTGAGSGIGRATALAFARQGASVVVSDVAEDGGHETVRLVHERGGEARFVRSDVAREEDVRALVDQAMRHYGRLDYACNNAGIGGLSAPTGEYTLAAWNEIIGVNLTGVWLCMRHEIPAMLESGGGAIVNMASILGHVGFANAPAYVAAKHGLIGLTQTAALEYATRGLRVNAVSPAFIVTPLLEKAGLLDEGSAVHAQLVGLHPMQRLGTAKEVAEAVVWLCSDAASFITGHALLVDGGYTVQ
jgi:NAD(P)-dependent dehydrogenase (short-subunit alcohol dehydrogenase family)